MSKSHSDKHERLDSGRVERRVVSAGAPAARNVLAVFLVFAIVFGLTFGFLFFADIKVGAAQVSESVVGADLPEADVASGSNYSVESIEVSSDGTVEIDSLAGLLIAAYAYNSGASISDILGSKIEGAQNANIKSFKLVDNISGIFTAQDIEDLNAAFLSGWGKSAEGNGALENVVKAEAGDTLTILNSLFGDFSGTFDGNGYVINTFNLMGGTDGTHKENAGFFAKIESGATVNNLHLRNVNVVADGVTSVGGIAGTALSDVTNVSVHGMFNVANGTNLGGIVGVLGERANASTLMKAIVMGTIYANEVKYVGGAVGHAENTPITKTISMMYIWSTVDIGIAGSVVANGGTESSYYLKNSVWIGKSDDVHTNKDHVNENSASSTEYPAFCGVYGNSVSGYVKGEIAYYKKAGQTSKGAYDVLDDFILDDAGYEEGNAPAPRESMRLCDLIDVYLLKYGLTEKRVQVDDNNYFNICEKSENSWLVGNAKGTDKVERGSDVKNADPIIICNQQGVSLLRELRFATFKLTADVYLPASYKFETWQGVFFGKIYNSKTVDNAYDENGYHIYIKGYKDENIFDLTPTDTTPVKFPVKGY